MGYLCCTKKIIDILGITCGQYVPDEDISLLGPWYANVFSFKRKKCLIFTNAKTLFSFVVINQTKKELKQIVNIFRRELLKRLQTEMIGDEVINKIMCDYEKVILCKTSDKRTLGSMNEFVFYFNVFCEMEEGPESCDINKFNGELGGKIMKLNGEYIIPREMLNEMIKNAKW